MQLKMKRDPVRRLAVHSSAQKKAQQRLRNGTELLEAFMA
jgi:hypothetical protein